MFAPGSIFKVMEFVKLDKSYVIKIQPITYRALDADPLAQLPLF
jgi:hypothetical protein